jgi:hypothetical protein
MPTHLQTLIAAARDYGRAMIATAGKPLTPDAAKSLATLRNNLGTAAIVVASLKESTHAQP